MKDSRKSHRQKHFEYDMDFENLAIPEVHTHKPSEEEPESEPEAVVDYDMVAIPEIHFHKNPKK